MLGDMKYSKTKDAAQVKDETPLVLANRDNFLK